MASSNHDDPDRQELVETQREMKGKVFVERRYFISSLPGDAAEIFAAFRRLALNMMKSDTSQPKLGFRKKKTHSRLESR